MKKFAMLVGGALALAACSTTPQTAAPVDLTNPMMAPGYLAMAASSDMFEMQSAQLAHQMTQNPAIHSFASMLQTDHTQSTQMLMATAQAARITPPAPTLMPQHQALLDQLRAAGTGYAFDQAFKDVQVQAHQQALGLHQGYATGGDVPALRTTAGQIVPVIQKHLNMAQSMSVMAPPPPPAPQMTPPSTRGAGERG
ncbi:MAG TPA: DUF4142 domain-containing protein [Sphingomicrobium sp.]|jgi:putative membrane protein